MSLKNGMLVHILRSTEVIMQALVFFIILLMMSYKTVLANSMEIGNCIVVAVLPVVILYLARQFVHNGGVLVLIHACAAAFILIRGNTADEKFAYIVIGAGLMIYSFSLCGKDKKDSSEKMPIGLLCIFIIAVIMGNSMAFSTLSDAGVICGGIFLILQIMHHNFSNVNKFIMLNQGIASIPVKQIMSVNGLLMAVLAILCGSIMLLFSNSYVDKMVQTVGDLIYGAFVVLLRYIFSIGSDLKPGSSLVTEQVEGNGIGELQALMEDSIWQDILQGIGVVLGIILAVVLLIGCIVWVVMALIKAVKNMSSETAGDVSEFLMPKDIAVFMRKRDRRDKNDKGNSANIKARKLYKSIVKKRAAKKGDRISDTMMPSDLSSLYIPNDEKEATYIYEKARYSNMEVTQQELAKLKIAGK